MGQSRGMIPCSWFDSIIEKWWSSTPIFRSHAWMGLWDKLQFRNGVIFNGAVIAWSFGASNWLQTQLTTQNSSSSTKWFLFFSLSKIINTDFLFLWKHLNSHFCCYYNFLDKNANFVTIFLDFVSIDHI